MKKIWKTMLAVLMCAAMLLTPALAFYYDGPSAWARQDVRAAIDSGFPNIETQDTAGYPSWTDPVGDRSFTSPITRVGFCQMIGTILSKEENLSSCRQYEQLYQDGYSTPFTDMNRVFYNYDVFVANYYGIIDGVSETKFDPYGTLTREEAAAALAKTVTVLRPSLWQEGKDYLADKTVADAEQLSSERANYVGFVLELGLMHGVGDGTFAPQEPFTIEQAVVTCYRLCRQLDVPGIIPAGQANDWLDTYRMNRELQYLGAASLYYEDGDVWVYYGGFADGIADISVEGITVDGVDGVREPFYTPDPVEEYIAELHFAAPEMDKDTYYTAHIRLTLTMENGEKKEITDNFVFLY